MRLQGLAAQRSRQEAGTGSRVCKADAVAREQGASRQNIVLRFTAREELERAPARERASAEGYTEAVCNLAVRTVCLALDIPVAAMRASTRCDAETALARQIAMYLANTKFNVLRSEVARQFGRDRTTVSHACRLVEDRRDDVAFDTMLIQLEELLQQAICAIEHAECDPEITGLVGGLAR